MNISDNLALIDANILIYADQEDSAYHLAAKALRDQAKEGKIALCVCPQVLNEYFAVVTNPRRVTNSRSAESAMTEVKNYIRARHIRKIYSGNQVLNQVQKLFDKRPISGVHIFDLYLVATMLENSVKRIYTYNTSDFEIFSEIEVLKPSDPQPTEDEQSQPI